MKLILSIFPGIDLLGRAFEEEGYCVVRGPDLLWGGDIHNFHPPADMFDGLIGGPPCQAFSRMRHLLAACGNKPRHGNLIPEFERCVVEAQPGWFLMENVPAAPVPQPMGYEIRDYLLNNRWIGGIQHRERRFSFGSRDGRLLDIEVVVFEALEWHHAALGDPRPVPVKMLKNGKPKKLPVMAGHGPTSSQRWNGHMTIAEMCELQGLPGDFLNNDTPFTAHGKRMVIGNGVPIPMGRAFAKAINKIEQS